MAHDPSVYGRWSLVIVNSAIFILFAFSFCRPKSRHDWRSFGAFSGFIIASFIEMYGFPLTIYLLSGWLQSGNPKLGLYSHDAEHLWWTLLGLRGEPPFNVVHLLSIIFIGAGFFLVAKAWTVLHAAQKKHALAVTGPYAMIRHPQYIGFILVIFGFLLQWPTLLTAAMFPALVFMYTRLARIEERETVEAFPLLYPDYAAGVPAFLPRLWRSKRRPRLHG